MTKRRGSQPSSDLGRTVFFPFSKEVHTLVRFADLLPASLRPIGILDFTCEPTDAGVALGLPPLGLAVTDDIACLNGADSLVILWSGIPLDHFSALFDARRVWQRFTASLRHAQRTGVRIVCLVAPSSKLVRYCLRHGIDLEVWQGTVFGSTPIAPETRLTARRLGIAGTSPCVGKFTTALFLERELARNGLEVGSIATEEAGALLCDVALSNRNVDLRALVPAALTALEGNDIIISAGQGGILDGGLPIYNVPWSIGYPLYHFALFRPHDVILVVKLGDDIQTIRDNITMIELMSRGRRPIALVIPEAEEIAYQHYRYHSRQTLKRTRDRLAKVLALPTVVVHSDGTGVQELARYVPRSQIRSRGRSATAVRTT